MPLQDFREADAYVLLGPPGSGKTEAFRHEAKCQGGHYVSARNFLTLADRAEWRQATLFIDGLDEARAGAVDGRTPFDAIRAKLDRLGKPRFRLSCREADWLGANDREHLKVVSRDGGVTVLRLDPLSDDQIRQFLVAHPDVPDPGEFVASARETGMDALLANPLSLRMLASAVGGGGRWPESRTQVFHEACRELLLERNREHRIAEDDRVDAHQFMDAGGKLCAVQLLTGAAGYSLDGDEDDCQFHGLDRVPGDRETFRRCVRTRLFEALTDCRVSPVHRQIAEFLAARYLAGLIGKGLPVGRILALITGDDGVTVSELRGLSAWLAAHSKRGRAELIARDPLGAVLYGDIGSFSPDEKQLVLDGLEREAERNPWFVKAAQLDARLGGLVSIDTENILREILMDPSREYARQPFMIILIEALISGEPLPELSQPIMRLIRDGSWWPRIRFRAVDAFRRHSRDDGEALVELGRLAADIYADRVQDPDDSLLGCLLTNLYPKVLSATEVMQYLRSSKRPGRCPGYENFWKVHLPGKATADQLALLLDEFVARFDRLRSEVRSVRPSVHFLRQLPSVFLSRFLELSGDEIELTRLFGWLGAAAWVGDWEYDPGAESDQERHIRSWLENHPEEWTALFAMGLKRCVDRREDGQPSGFNECMFMEQRRMVFSSTQPPDFGLWCLHQVKSVEDRDVAAWLVNWIAQCLYDRRCDEGLSRKVVSERLADRVRLRKLFDGRMAELEAPKPDEALLSRVAPTRETTGQHNWRDLVKPYEDALRRGHAKPALLHQLATAYFGGYIDVEGVTAHERLNHLLGHDRSLVEAVLSGLLRTIGRDDLPTDAEIMRLGLRNETHHLALPFMAGMEEAAKSADDMCLEAAQSRLALTVHFTVPMWPWARPPADRTPGWLPALLMRCPEIVADVLVRFASSRMRNGGDLPAGLHELLDHSGVARLSALPLLNAFPVRCTDRQLPDLNRLLWTACRHGELEPLMSLIDNKLSLGSMNVAQRVHWLATGLYASPGTYLGKLEDYAAGSERRIRFLARAVAGYDFGSALDRCHRVPALQVLIRLVGASFRPSSGDAGNEDGSTTPETNRNAAFGVRDFVNQLSSIPTPSATAALAALLSDPKLLPWRTILTDAAYRQNALRRETGFRYRDVDQVLETLDGRKPANVADLMALTLEHLREISGRIRDGNTSDWRQYWNVNGDENLQEPRPENACRDTLLSDLRGRLEPLGIDAQPEGRYADDKRADIRVSHDGRNVPVEIKRSCHRDIWRAIRTQLIAKYTRDSDAEGYGIYLVFWFGDTERCQPTPPASGSRPRTAAELEERLRATLSADEMRRIGVCVVDVASPARPDS